MQHSVYYVFKNMWVVKETMSSSKRSFSDMASDLASEATRRVRHTSLGGIGRAAIAAVGSAALAVAVSLGVMHATDTPLLRTIRSSDNSVFVQAQEIFRWHDMNFVLG